MHVSILTETDSSVLGLLLIDYLRFSDKDQRSKATRLF